MGKGEGSKGRREEVGSRKVRGMREFWGSAGNGGKIRRNKGRDSRKN